jgi:hypothetical protein
VNVRQWILLAALGAIPLGCVSAPNDALFKGGVNGSTGGDFIGSSGGAPGMGGAIQQTGGSATIESGGVPNQGAGGIPIAGAGGMLGSGGFNFAGSPLDGSASGGFMGTGGFSSGGAPGDGGAEPADARPDAREQCPSGHYTGTLTGPYRTTLSTTTFMARLEFTIEPAGTIAGTLVGTSDTTSRATLSGSVNCKTGEVSMSIDNGTYRSGILGTTQYVGTMTAAFDSSRSSFTNGKWEITEPNSTGTGSGTWSASAN